MNVVPFPIAARRQTGERLALIDRFRDLVPEHRKHVFNSLSDDDQFKLARHFLSDTSPELRPAWAAYEADAARSAEKIDGSVVLR